MSERLISLLLTLSPRERWLLGGMFGLALPLGIVFLGLVPLSDARSVAAQSLMDARNLHQWVDQRAGDYNALGTGGAAPQQATPPIGISGIEQSLKQMGLRQAVTHLSNRDGSAIELRFDVVNFRALTDWLALTQPEWGYDLRAYRIERSDRPGLVSAEFLLGIPE